MRLDTDILIVGAGAAGSVLAATLSDLTSRRIVLCDKGGHYTRTFFNQREWDMGVLYAGRGARATADGAIAVRGGECVGGGTTVNYALAFNPVQRVWTRWARSRGLTGFSFDPNARDYGLDGLNMANCLEEVRQRTNVHPIADADINENNRLFEDGCRALGITTRRFELNMRGCIGCGFCAEGCAYDHKLGTLVTYVPDAVSRGVTLIHHCDMDEITVARRGGRLIATGARGRVRPTSRGSQPNAVSAGPIDIRAKLVVVAAGAVESPVLLQRSDHPDPHQQIGRGLILHPSLAVLGLRDGPIVNYRGVTGAIYSDHFANERGFYLECLFGHPVYGATIAPSFGPDHFQLMRRLREMNGFGVMLVDTVDPANRVEYHAPSGSRRIHYRLSTGDRERLRFAAARAVEVMFASGAREVLLPSDEPIGPLASPRFSDPSEAQHCAHLMFEPHQTVLSSAHCQATLKMGEDPSVSVVNSRGESHHVQGLLVCDGSVFPESCGVNPMLSIMTMARYQGRRIAAELPRYDL